MLRAGEDLSAPGMFPWFVLCRPVSLKHPSAPVRQSCPRADYLRCASGDGFPSLRRVRALGALWQRVRPAATAIHARASCRLLSGSQEPRQNFGCLLPLARFLLQLFAPGARQLVILGFAIVVGGAPLRGNVAFLLQLEQGGVQRSVVHRQQVAAGLLDPARDPVSVQRPQRLQRLQHHQGQRALPNVLFLTHSRSPVAPYGLPIPICYSPYGNAIEETHDPSILFPGFLFFFRPCTLTLPKLLTSLIRLPLRLPGDGCPL